MRLMLVAAANSVHTQRWADAFATRGHEVHLVSQHAPAAPLHAAVRLHLLPHLGGLGYLLNRRAARALAERLRPDAVNAHYASGYGTLAPRPGFAPLVLNVWGSDVYEFPDAGPLHRWLLRRNLRRADAVVSTSHAMAERTRQVCPDLGPISVVPFGVDTGLFQPAERPADAPLVIGTVKTLAPKYGIDTLIHAFAILVGSGGLPAARLRIVGGGPERQRLQQLVGSLGLQDRVDLIGPVPHHQVPQELQRLDVYVALSRTNSESFGVAVIEASACGLPVVVSRVGGLPEVVEEGVTGLVVPKEAPEAAAEAISRLARSVELRRSMGLAGRARVLKHYAWPACVDLQLAVIENAIKASRAR